MAAARIVLFILVLVELAPLSGQSTPWKVPPAPLRTAIDRPGLPEVIRGPGNERFLLVRWERLLPLSRLASPYLSLAGYRVDPGSGALHGRHGVVELRVLTRETGRSRLVPLPQGLPGRPLWSGDASRFALPVTTAKGTELWVGDASGGRLRRVLGPRVAANRYRGFGWNPDGRRLLVRLVPEGRKPPGPGAATPSGPNVRSADGKAAPEYPSQDLLVDGHDDALFRHHMGHELAWIDVGSRKITVFGKEAVYNRVTLSPDGKHLCVHRTLAPFLRGVPAYRFNEIIEAWTDEGTVLRKLHQRQMAEYPWRMKEPQALPHYYWNPLRDATLVWASGPTKGARDPRALLAEWAAPFRPREWRDLARTEHPMVGLRFMDDGRFLLTTYDGKRRHNITWLVGGRAEEEGSRLTPVFDIPYDRWYGHPGYALQRVLPNGFAVVRVHDNGIFLEGRGATSEGDRPFLDRLDLKTMKARRLWRCTGKRLEQVHALLADNGGRVLITSESPSEPPDWWELDLGSGKRRRVTRTEMPSTFLSGVSMQFLKYQRADGVPLSATLYTPEKPVKDKPLPGIVWAYPTQHDSKESAGEVVGSPHQWVEPLSDSHAWLVHLGYAVLDAASIPVIGDLTRANDRLVQEMTLGARAAIDQLVKKGVDRKQVLVGGHSYGGFMTATLLAHTDLFRAGIARSGFYNTTLTPFGFQDERRSLWEARDVYLETSPFHHADRIKEPLLLIHGEKDANGNCFPLQSERFFEALKGCGATARLVMLPHEGHAYLARETVSHVLAEMADWCDRHLR